MPGTLQIIWRRNWVLSEYGSWLPMTTRCLEAVTPPPATRSWEEHSSGATRPRICLLPLTAGQETQQGQGMISLPVVRGFEVQIARRPSGGPVGIGEFQHFAQHCAALAIATVAQCTDYAKTPCAQALETASPAQARALSFDAQLSISG